MERITHKNNGTKRVHEDGGERTHHEVIYLSNPSLHSLLE
jgi:hypothetical protein